jgi:hypothetical protein
VTYLTLEWPASADTELPVIGYELWLKEDAVGGGDYEIAYNGTNYPNVRKFTMAAGLQTGMSYSFTVKAVNSNGAGAASTPAQYTMCTAPGTLQPPLLAAVTKLTMQLTWQPPLSEGGC